MTTDVMSFRDPVEKSPDADLLREMIGFAAEHLMELEVGAVTGAAYGEKDPGRRAQRNGYRERDWETRPERWSCASPSAQGQLFPGFLEPRLMAGKALTAVIQEAYVQGISTRSVGDLAKAMGMSGISKSQVSRLCEEIDGKVKAFLNRPIEGDWPYLSIDATYLKVRRGGRIVLNRPAFSRRPRLWLCAAVRTRWATASRSVRACGWGCRTSRCNRTRPRVPRRACGRSCGGYARA